MNPGQTAVIGWVGKGQAMAWVGRDEKMWRDWKESLQEHQSSLEDTVGTHS